MKVLYLTLATTPVKVLVVGLLILVASVFDSGSYRSESVGSSSSVPGSLSPSVVDLEYHMQSRPSQAELIRQVHDMPSSMSQEDLCDLKTSETHATSSENLSLVLSTVPSLHYEIAYP